MENTWIFWTKASVCMAIALTTGCRLARPKAKPDLSIKRVELNGVRLAVKEDKSWMGQKADGLEGFHIRIDYTPGRTFTMQQNSLIDFGMQEDFDLVEGGDTVKPVFFQRIANGAANQAEYVAAFGTNGRIAATGSITGTTAGSHRQLLFRDPIFGLGNQVIPF